MPSWLLGKLGVDLRGNPYREKEYTKVVDNLRGQRPQAPPLGPVTSQARVTGQEAMSQDERDLHAAQDTGLIRITRVVTEQVTSPRISAQGTIRGTPGRDSSIGRASRTRYRCASRSSTWAPPKVLHLCSH
jgi:hypothetical protein